MKRVRLLIYEGSSDWLSATITCSQPVGINRFGAYNTIKVIENLSEMSDIIQRMETQRELDDSIPPEESA